MAACCNDKACEIEAVYFHCQLTLFFISGRPSYAFILRYVAKRLGSSNVGHLPTKMRVTSAWKSTPMLHQRTFPSPKGQGFTDPLSKTLTYLP